MQSVTLDRDDASSNRHPALPFSSMILSENRYPPFRIMLLASDIIGLKARSLRSPSVCGDPPGAVLCTANDVLSERYPASDRGRRRGAGAAARSDQHDARRLAEPLAKPDAVAGAFAIRRHRHHHARGLGDGPLAHDPDAQTLRERPWSSSIESSPAPAMTAPRRWAAASA